MQHSIYIYCISDLVVSYSNANFYIVKFSGWLYIHKFALSVGKATLTIAVTGYTKNVHVIYDNCLTYYKSDLHIAYTIGHCRVDIFLVDCIVIIDRNYVSFSFQLQYKCHNLK